MAIKYPYVYDRKKRAIARSYTREKMTHAFVNGMAVPALFFAALALSGFGTALYTVLPSVPLYAAVFYTLLSIAQLPVSFYSSFIYEHKHRLSTQDVTGWIKDYAKSKALSYVFFVPTVAALYYFMTFQNWWLIAGAAYATVSLLIDYVSPILILPIFYKLKPYTNRAHRQSILRMCRKLGVGGISNVLVANESSRSVKANALFTGFGRMKRIVLFDTLVRNFTQKEINTVIAHEVGHYVNKDVHKDIIIGIAMIFPILYAISAALGIAAPALNINAYSPASLPLIALFYMLIDFAVMPVMAAYSRRREAAADFFSLEHVRAPEAQISTEKKLCDMALIDDNPPKWMKLMFFDHPPARERIEMAEKWKRKE
ncbi:MAG: M48 family metallopeptidase [Candidatus Aenigmarchaeota archaeon]|nr:M48 family metallopeptidase [Candidatus Aenigmarchaeota archaeon]